MKQNYTRKILLIFFTFFTIYQLNAQLIFDNKTPQYLKGITRSTLTMGFVDVDGDHFDDLITLDEGNKIVVGLYRGEGIPLKYIFSEEPVSFDAEWSFGVGDLDGDGMCEVLTTGLFNGVKVFKYDSLLNSFKIQQKISTNSYGQGCNIVDVNQDGKVDFFLSNDHGESRILLNNGNGSLVNTPGIIDFTTNPISDLSGNYGSSWVDIDDDGILELFMAKCSQFAPEAIDPRRINQLYKKMEDGVYIDIAPTIGLADGSQTWTSVFEDLDNDGDLDLITANHYELHKIFENRNGIFVNQPFPLQENVFSFQVLGADFDNDGLVDIYFTGDSDFILKNKGNFEFEIINNPLNGFKVHSATFGDINRDGVVDVFAGFGQPIVKPGDRRDEIWLGRKNENNFISFSLTGISSNLQGIGAKVKIFGPWGIQQRNIRGGQGYSMVNTRNALFGLGQAEMVDSVIVQWPNGTIQKFNNLPGNKYYLIEENGCIYPFYSWESEGSQKLCPGAEISISGELDLTTIKWSDGFSSENHLIQEDIPLFFYGTDMDGCVVQSEIFNQIHRLDASLTNIIQSDTVYLCDGLEIELSSENIDNIEWSSGNNSHAFVPENSAQYHVTFSDICGNVYSDTVFAQLIDPDSELIPDTVKLGEDLDLFVPGENVFWYTDSFSQDYFYNGNTLSLFELERDTAFFLEREVYVPQDTIQITGDRFIKDLYAADHLNFSLTFDLFQDIIIHRIRVYTDKVGEREFQIFNENGILIFSKRIFVNEGENEVLFDAHLSAGMNYSLTTNSDVNLLSLGHEGPRFQVSENENIFPIIEEGVISLNGFRRVQGYYFYYDLLFSPLLDECVSQRIRKDVVVQFTDQTEDFFTEDIKIFPNPSFGLLYLDSDHSFPLRLQIMDASGKLMLEEEFIGRTRFDLRNLSAGVYLIRVIDGHRSKLLKWVKVR